MSSAVAEFDEADIDSRLSGGSGASRGLRSSRGCHSTAKQLPLHMIPDDEVSSEEEEDGEEGDEDDEDGDVAHGHKFAARWSIGSAWHLEQRWGGVHSLAAMLHHHKHTGEEGGHPEAGYEKRKSLARASLSVAGRQLRQASTCQGLRAATPSSESKLPAIQEGNERGGKPTSEHPGRDLSNRGLSNRGGNSAARGGCSGGRNGADPSNPRPFSMSQRPFSMKAWDGESGEERALGSNELSA